MIINQSGEQKIKGVLSVFIHDSFYDIIYVIDISSQKNKRIVLLTLFIDQQTIK